MIGSIAALFDFLSANSAKLIVLDMNLPGARNSEVLKKIASMKDQARLIFGGISFTPAAELAASPLVQSPVVLRLLGNPNAGKFFRSYPRKESGCLLPVFLH